MNREANLELNGPSSPEDIAEARENPYSFVTPETVYEQNVAARAVQGEGIHRKHAVEDFANGDVYYRSITIDPAMQQRIAEHAIGKDINAIFTEAEQARSEPRPLGSVPMLARDYQNPSTKPIDPTLN